MRLRRNIFAHSYQFVDSKDVRNWWGTLVGDASIVTLNVRTFSRYSSILAAL